MVISAVKWRKGIESVGAGLPDLAQNRTKHDTWLNLNFK